MAPRRFDLHSFAGAPEEDVDGSGGTGDRGEAEPCAADGCAASLAIKLRGRKVKGPAGGSPVRLPSPPSLLF